MTDKEHRFAGNNARMAGMGLALALGAAACGLAGQWHYAALVGWAAACAVYIVWAWAQVWRMDPMATKEHASIEDPARAVGDVILLAAAVASLGALLLAFARADTAADEGVLGLVAIVSVALSWLLVHTLHALKYARVYHRLGGGVDFGGDEPAYSDFAYLAFTIGMTYQVSDTALTAREMRKIALFHALLSFLFGAVILACAINLVVSLVSG